MLSRFSRYNPPAVKVPISMLREYVDTTLEASPLAHLFTMAGFEVESVEEVEGEPVLDVNIMANRGDGLSILGLAREVAAKDPGARRTPLFDRLSGLAARSSNEGSGSAKFSIDILTEHCSRYAAGLFEINAVPTPPMIQRRLLQMGMRPISFIVDLTNYVMLELGQPLHAFDFDKVRDGKIVVRQAREGEVLVTLDGVERKLNPEMMMICDSERPIALAGVMGGLETEFSGSTQRVLLESAHFNYRSVRRTRRSLGMSTEASYRFERGVDPEGVVRAILRFSELLEEAGGGRLSGGVVDLYPSPPIREAIQLRMSRSDALLGMSVSPSSAKGYLQALGFEVEGAESPFTVAAPTWRTDIEREVDLIEEIGRVHGYEHIPEKLPEGSTTPGGVVGESREVDRLREELVRCGLVQVVNYSFESESPLDDPNLTKVGPRNPVSQDVALLRSCLWQGLAESCRRNGGMDVHLCEMGRVFGGDVSGVHERRELAILSVGSLVEKHWSDSQSVAVGFYSLKECVERTIAAVERPVRFEPAPADPRLHPTRQAAIVSAEGNVLGHCGQIHPDVADQAGLSPETFLARLTIDDLLAIPRSARKLAPVSRNPAVRRDMAVLVSKSVPFEAMRERLVEACGEVLERLWVFDVFEGSSLPEGTHSVGVALQLRKLGQNLTDEEANQVRDRAAKALESLGARLR